MFSLRFINYLVLVSLTMSVELFVYRDTAKSQQVNVTKSLPSHAQLVTSQTLAVKFSEIPTPIVNFPKETYPEVKLPEITSPEIQVQENQYLTIITLPAKILFEEKKDELRLDAKNALQQVSQIINNRYPETWLQILGHTNLKGTQAYNLNLSEQRVTAVEQWLREQGRVNVSMITKQGYGETQPVMSESNSDCSHRASQWKNSDRIEIVIQKLDNKV
jgi:outer membrane protein OmpA-like peptidoglycan-associated protein